jgi:hypothetical protein
MMPRLSLRAVAAPGWRWMPGMLANGRILDFSPAGSEVIKSNFIVTSVEGSIPKTSWGSQSILDASPVLEDPATRGCLLQLVREAAPGATATTFVTRTWSEAERRERLRWICNYFMNGEFHQASGETEEEALVVALELIGRK